ncbi:MAG TPA: phytanoyl-CoA dioxygenase family protein [Alphaproteobacteria bacterium]|nr:phytanoyl-CoA dioxygenase family protein [Alphaproteobacteria bacterium]
MTKRKSKLWRHWLMMPLYALAVASSAKSFRDNPVIGSPRLNQRGLHILRRELARPLGVYRRRRLESLISQADREAFARDGFIVKPNFLPPAEFKALQDEILNLDAPAREAIIGDTLTRLIPLDGKVLPRLPVARSVLEGKRYRNLLAYVGSFRRVPHLYVQTVFSKHRPDAEPDIQSFYHSDTFHPTVKSWLFLDDVKIDSTPFTYVPGSHIANKRRLAWERRTSITAKDGKDKLTAEGSFRISEVEIRRLGYGAPVSLPVAANTLVVADTSGFHARGTAAGQTTRLSIWAYSRSNPFLPWTGGDLVGLPFVKARALRIYWAVTDRLKDKKKAPREWRWVGNRSPLAPPEG